MDVDIKIAAPRGRLVAENDVTLVTPGNGYFRKCLQRIGAGLSSENVHGGGRGGFGLNYYSISNTISTLFLCLHHMMIMIINSYQLSSCQIMAHRLFSLLPANSCFDLCTTLFLFKSSA